MGQVTKRLGKKRTKKYIQDLTYRTFCESISGSAVWMEATV